MIEKLTHLPLLLKKQHLGLEPTPYDERDFQTGIWGWGEYKPKSQRKEIKTLSVKDQGNLNTCQWNATIAQKEPDENCCLNVRSLVAYGAKNNMVSGNGFSNLRSGQKCLKDWGAVEGDQLPEQSSNWYSYINVDIPRLTPNANKHKTATYWSVSSRNDILKLLDEDRLMTTGIDWYTDFNQGGGFATPWIIERAQGYKVGGHAILLKGYDLNYHSKKVYIFQNSYSREWGDEGKFYIEMNYFENHNYGIYVNLDISIDIGKFINDYDGKNVKGSSPIVYFIQKGQKKPYPDEITYLAFNVNDTDIKSYSLADDEILNKIPIGDIMDIKKSLYWDYLKDISNENRVKALIDLLHKK